MLPLELDENILDQCQEQVRTILACVLVCKRWQPRCQQHLYREAHIRNRHQLYSFHRSLSANTSLRQLVKTVIIASPIHTPHIPGDFAALDLAAVLLASVLPNLNALAFRNDSDTSPRVLHMGPSTLRCVRAMRRLSKLVLSEICFVNLASFCRFILAFPSLKMLECYHVDAATHEFQHIVEAFTTQTLEIRALNVSPFPLTRCRHNSCTCSSALGVA